MIQVAGGIILAFLVLVFLPEVIWLAWTATKICAALALIAIIAIPLLVIIGAI